MEAEEEELTAADYKKLDATVEKMANFFDKYKDELDEKAKTDIYDFLVRDVMGAAAGSGKGRKIVDMLPPYPDSLPKVRESGGALAYSQPKSHRSIDWLESHGRCIDNIRPGPSTILNAGESVMCVLSNFTGWIKEVCRERRQGCCCYSMSRPGRWLQEKSNPGLTHSQTRGIRLVLLWSYASCLFVFLLRSASIK